MLNTACIWKGTAWIMDFHTWGHYFNSNCLYQMYTAVVVNKYNHDFLLYAVALAYIC